MRIDATHGNYGQALPTNNISTTQASYTSNYSLNCKKKKKVAEKSHSRTVFWKYMYVTRASRCFSLACWRTPRPNPRIPQPQACPHILKPKCHFDRRGESSFGTDINIVVPTFSLDHYHQGCVVGKVTRVDRATGVPSAREKTARRSTPLGSTCMN